MSNQTNTRGKYAAVTALRRWADGWNDRLENKPWREVLEDRNYEYGRLYASEGLALGLKLKPITVRDTKSGRGCLPPSVSRVRKLTMARYGSRPVPPAFEANA
jgi:hypothetical protein